MLQQPSPRDLPVLVGVDGSPSSSAAVDVAAREAELRRRSLWIVHASVWPLLNVPMGPSRWGPPQGGLRNQTERVVHDAVTRATTGHPGLAVTSEVATGAAAPVLLAYSRVAELTVVGDRGLGGFTGLLVGSIAVELAAHSPRPVLVVRGHSRTEGPVVVGVDGSPANQPAVGHSFETAGLRHAPLVAVHAWTLPRPATPRAVLRTTPHLGGVAGEEERLLSEALAGWTEQYPDVDVEHVLALDDPRVALIGASTRAQLLVVGTRGRGGFAGLLLGSVSQAAMHHARCPVAIVPDPVTRPAEPDPIG